MKPIATYKYETLQVGITDNILTVTLNRPHKKNAMSFKVVNELIALAGRISKDQTIRAVILNGAGGTFCAGIDLGDLNHPKNKAFAFWELVKPWQSAFQRVCLVWRDLPVPVIAVLEGYCIGAGLQLALACDVRISHPDCQLSIMEAKWGLVPDMGLTQSAFGVVREDVLKELAMSARIIDADEAQALGLVSHCGDNPLEQAKQLATEFSERSPDAVLASKRIINAMHH
ncbi:MAG: crotonase/enoyl-CoA hydratase family protein, partial [Psychrobacter sp.]